MVSGLRVQVTHFAVASAFFLLVNAICALLHWAILVRWFGGTVQGLDIVFLPFGALVVLAWFYGWVMVPLILPAALLSQAVAHGAMAFDSTMMQALLLKLVAFPLVFGLFRMGGIDARAGQETVNWRVFVLVGLLTSVVLATLRHWFSEWSAVLAGPELLRSMLATVTEDMIGLMLVMFGLMMVFRQLRQV